MAGPQYDVFLSHNGADKPAVEELALRLQREGIQPWFDKSRLVPGEPWQGPIERALDDCASCAVFIGPSGFGLWHEKEMRAAIDNGVNSQGRFRVIPVLLPGAERPERSRLPAFLRAATWIVFRESLDEPEAFRRLVCGIRGIAPDLAPREAPFEGQCPYRGLKSFGPDDAPFFFGREALTEWLSSALRPPLGSRAENRFLAIIGPSGSGKSSLALAGLVPALKRGNVGDGTPWPVVICRPGYDPLESLAKQLTGLGDRETKLAEMDELIEKMKCGRQALHRFITLALRDEPPASRLAVVMDQFEEVFTLCRDSAARQALIDNLLYAANIPGGQTVVVLTLRADFYGKCASHADLAAALSVHQLLVGPMSED
jgi:hypothetical protein